MAIFCFASDAGAVPSGNRSWPTFEPLVDAAGPSVVNIAVRKNENRPSTIDMQTFFYNYVFDRFPQDFLRRELGTGFIIDRKGLILTTNHIIEDASDIIVQLCNGRNYKATIVGQDPQTDMALISINSHGDDLKPLSFDDSDDLKVGDWVVAIGNPLGFGNTVTCGIVSASYRNIGIGIDDSFIQTDASINPGNSGGPLLNMGGKVVGINSVIAGSSLEDTGISFAIPINQVKRILPQLRHGNVKRSWLGIHIQNVTPELKQALHLKSDTGALISQVIPGGPASKSGLRRGDVVVAFDNHVIRRIRELTGFTAVTPVGKRTTIDIVRQGSRIQREITMEERVEPIAAALETEPCLGLTLQTLTAEIANDFGFIRTTGVLITEMDEALPAFDAGLEPGDIIIEVDQLTTANLQIFKDVMENHPPDQALLLLVDRKGSTIYFAIPLHCR